MRRNTQKRLYTLLFMVLVMCALFCMNRREVSPPGRESRTAVVERVIDGDTFVLVGGERVRLIGVDTPELGRRDRKVQYFAEEARDFLTELIEGKGITLTSDWRGKDRYERTLAYVYLGDSVFVNLEIIKQGFGFVYTSYPFDYMEEFRDEQRAAMRESRGLWGREIAEEELTAVRPHEAHEHYGESVVVKGKIVRTHNTGKVCFLDFDRRWKKGLTAVIFARSFHKFPEKPEDYYMGKDVRIAGEIEEYEGAPQIILNDRTEIEILP
jgi:endonuclease YncB( thermonuclease family)